MKFVDGCDFSEFSRYLAKLRQYTGIGELYQLKRNLDSGLFHLIVFRENDKIIGHAIWHETTTVEHRKGLPRDKIDRQILEGFIGKNRSFVELHELWLLTRHRGKGYGKQFFNYFEPYVRNKGYEEIVFYAFNPAAVGLCRKRGYKEAYGVKEAGPYGKYDADYVFYLRLKKD